MSMILFLSVSALALFMTAGVVALVWDTLGEIKRDHKRNKQWKQARKAN
jgi:hypothetical protein